MKESFLTSTIHRFYPETTQKVQTLIESNILLEKLLTKVYKTIDDAVQKYADVAVRVRVLARMIEAWRDKQYRDISNNTIFISILILVYFVSPIDVLPDFIPLIGGLDDVLLLNYLLKIIDQEIEKFIEWENTQ